MEIYRKGQGRITRNASLALLSAIAIFSFQGVHRLLAAYGLAGEKWLLLSVAERNFYLSHIFGLVSFLVLLLLAVRWTWFSTKSVDFLIDVEGELRKVVWPYNPEGRTIGEKTRELRVHSMVVVCVVLFMAYVLFLFDKGFSKLMQLFLTL